MIGRLRGLLIEKQAPEVLIECAGVGYEVHLPMSSFYHLPAVGQEAVIYIHFVVREDAQLLFGFCHKQERALFRELIKTNGVGPKMALGILSGMSAEQFIQCVHHEDLTALVKIPGVGKKTAERLIIEMRDRLKNFNSEGEHGDGVPMPAVMDNVPALGSSKDEALSALLALGYKAPQAQKVINSVHQPDMDSEQLIREALRAML